MLQKECCFSKQQVVQCSDISRVLYTSVQRWHSPPGVSTCPTGSRLSPTGLPPLWTPATNGVSWLLLVLPGQLQIWVLLWPPSGSIICWKNSQHSGKCCPYKYSFNLKDITQEQPNGRDAWGKVGGGWVQSFSILSLGTPLRDFHQPAAAPNLSIQEFSSKFHFIGMID